MSKRVLLGMSGGIDSTVSAMLLLEQGYEVVGATFRTYDSIKESCLAREKGCCSVDSIMEAKANCKKMGIEHHIVDFRDTFREHIISNFISEYMSGRTPNPCVLCNSYIKWGAFMDEAKRLGCEFVATGHYAQIAERNGHVFLHTAADEHKDQTYFLWRVEEEKLRHIIFPLGHLTKPQVREIARQHGYVALAEKAESQEICFVTDNDYRHFLRDNVSDYDQRVLPGNFIATTGHVVGRHQGFCNYTIGQRKGLGIALGKPVFVTKIDAERNEVTLGDNADLLTTEVTATDMMLVDPDWLKADNQVMARIRYKSKPVSARLVNLENGVGHFIFDEPVWGVTPGQSLVLYKDNLLVGGGFLA
ncbi:MAG: tRNA 2-thiouridine(34) synthase MnmA [Paludibacteraceae bacterium]|nr:tRNA 2-thiouridine(34) synthase MnmA [Paludibacteraceae bacterium]